MTGQRPIGDHWLTLITPDQMTEEKLEKSESYVFGDCALDADRRELRVAGESVTTQPKAFELLLYLVRNRHRAVDKEELKAQLAALRDQPAAAVDFMNAARSSAGEAWQESDDQVLESYHDAVAAMALR